MKYTDFQLKSALVKDCPDLIEYVESLDCLDRVNHEMSFFAWKQNNKPVSDKEWLQICWDTEDKHCYSTTNTNCFFYTEFLRRGAYPLWRATWQQRVISMIEIGVLKV